MRRRSRRSSGLADSSAHSRCCTLLLYGVKKATYGTRKWPLTWVGVAGFEPAASSSRSQIALRTARAAVCLIWERPSVNVRQRPVMNVAIVTQLVTRLASESVRGWVHAWYAVT